MLNFLISIIVFAVSAFLLAMSVRYGMMGAERVDTWVLSKSRRSFQGFDWYYRIPFSIGTIPEYFFAMVLGRDNYFKTNWWALKTTSFIAVLLFVALLKSRATVVNYYSLSFLGDRGIAAFFTSGTFVWYLNFITLMYLALAVLVTIESVKMAGLYAPVRVVYYGFLCLMMANLTLLVLGVIVFVAVVYFIFKVVKFLFFSNRKRHVDQEDEESAGDILNKGLAGFKPELYEWEANRKSQIRKETKPIHKPIIHRSKPVITRKQKPEIHDDDIPRLYPD
ncbi:MAG: hypothetical protein A2W85_07580 [Bacteroidetes bacterium GWF2_41_31]|nr:MAG: hypothetical protein A2W85_07580 [Bacteroidetes bacterium GWF2_41_31]